VAQAYEQLLPFFKATVMVVGQPLKKSRTAIRINDSKESRASQAFSGTDFQKIFFGG
jgi:hypothetical protein